MKNEASFYLRKQVNGKGYYVWITLELQSVEDAEASTFNWEYNDQLPIEKWLNSINTGIELFTAYFKSEGVEEPKKYTIRVMDIQ